MMRAVVAVVLAGLVASTVAAHASSLPLDAGVLQTQTIPAQIDVPNTPTYTIDVVGRRFNSGNGNFVGETRIAQPASLPAGTAYTISWTGSTVIACSSVGYTVAPSETEGIAGTFVANGDVTHAFCAQTGNGEITIHPQTSTASSTATTPPAQPTDEATTSAGAPATAPLWSPELDGLAGGSCRDDGWRSLRAPSGEPYPDEQTCVEHEVAAYRARVGSDDGQDAP